MFFAEGKSTYEPHVKKTGPVSFLICNVISIMRGNRQELLKKEAQSPLCFSCGCTCYLLFGFSQSQESHPSKITGD